jgi:hypothetical protein
MNLAASSVRIALNCALGMCAFAATGSLVWGGQSQQPEKAQTGSQAGSSGKAGEQMGSEGTTESPLRKCDSVTTKTETKKKAVTKKKAKKPPATTKTS